MPRRGRHRTSLPLRLVAIVAALFLTGGAVVIAGSAAADDSDGSDGGGVLSSLSKGSDSDDSGESGGDSDDSDDSGKDSGDDDGKGSDDSSNDSDDDKSSGKSSKANDAKKGEDAQKSGQGGENSDDEGNKPDEAQVDQKQKDRRQRLAEASGRGQKKDDEEFPGRDKIAPAGKDDYVDITEVEANGNIGDGGVFGGGSYSVDCGVSDHNNSDNYMAAPGKRNGAQHVHEYVGNKTVDANTEDHTLAGGPTSCGNGDASTWFWPVLRDLKGKGPDVGKDGGSLDGNVGRILKPRSAELTFNGHPGQETKPLPQGLMMIMGNAKAKAQGGDNANSKYTCSGFENRVTDKYPICPSGSKLKRLLDYPSCWDGENLDSKDFRSHIFYPGKNGRCDSDQVPVPQLRVTLTYDQPAGRAFAIDTFPDNQHDPTTDHSDYENGASEAQNAAGAECINTGQRCKT